METAISPKLAVCPKCEHPFFINENEVENKKLYYIKRDAIPEYDDLDDWYDHLVQMSDEEFKKLVRNNRLIYSLDEFVSAINNSDVYINDKYYARALLD